MLELWKKQLALKKFGVTHTNPKIFISSEWQNGSEPSLSYLIYRLIITIFFFVSWIMSIVDLAHINQSPADRARWLIYLTNWGFTVCTIQAMLSTSMLSYSFLTANNGDAEPTAEADNGALKLYKVYWVTHIIATDIAFGITIIYWLFIYDENKMPLDGMNVIVHVINSVLMLLDIWIVAHPVRLLHFYMPVTFGICYVFFSIIYFAAGGTNKDGTVYIYPILNWSKPGMTVVVCIIVMVFLLFLHGLTYGMYRTRKYISNRTRKAKDPINKEPNKKESYKNPAMSNDVV